MSPVRLPVPPLQQEVTSAAAIITYAPLDARDVVRLWFMADKKTSKKKASVEADEAAAPAVEKGAPAAAPKAEVLRQPKAAKNVKKEKLAPKNKSRLPRRQKKAEKKKAAAARL